MGVHIRRQDDAESPGSDGASPRAAFGVQRSAFSGAIEPLCAMLSPFELVLARHREPD